MCYATFLYFFEYIVHSSVIVSDAAYLVACDDKQKLIFTISQNGYYQLYIKEQKRQCNDVIGASRYSKSVSHHPS